MQLSQSAARRIRRGVAALAVTLAGGAGAFASLGGAAGAAHAAARPAASAGYVFQTLDNSADPTFNQLLGINSKGVIAGYFGSGAAGSPNQGYLLDPAYGASSYVSENYPNSQQTQVVGLNNLGDTAGFWVNKAGANKGFVEWNGSFASYVDPNTPHIPTAVNQLLGVNNKGVAVGFYNDAKGHSHAYQVNQATSVFTAIHVPGTSAVATGINNNGDIVGTATSSTGVTSSWLLKGTQLISYQDPAGTDTQAFGVNDNDQIVGSYQDSTGNTHGFVLTDPMGPVSHWTTVDDPNDVGGTTVNGINDAGDLVGFYCSDNATVCHGMLATPAVPVTKHLQLMPMPSATVSFGQDTSGNLTADVSAFGLTPGSAHAVQLLASDGSVLATFGTLTASAVGQADADLDSSYAGSVPSGSTLVIRNGTGTASVATEPIAETAALTGGSGPVSLNAVEISPKGTSYGTPAGQATVSYDPADQTLSVTVTATGVSPGLHAAHIHLGSCASQGGVQYMLMDFMANSQGQIVNETRTVTSVTTPIPPSGWYLNLHQGNSNNILHNGSPTILFRPLLCQNV